MKTATDGDRVRDRLPECDTLNPAELEAFYGNFGYADHFRKVCLSNCREIERARATAREQKVSEARLDDLARTSDTYIDYLIVNLNGRRLREEEVRNLARMGA